MYLAVLWIRIRIGSVFRSFLDPDPNWAKILDPDPNSMYLEFGSTTLVSTCHSWPASRHPSLCKFNSIETETNPLDPFPPPQEKGFPHSVSVRIRLALHPLKNKNARIQILVLRYFTKDALTP